MSPTKVPFRRMNLISEKAYFTEAQMESCREFIEAKGTMQIGIRWPGCL